MTWTSADGNEEPRRDNGMFRSLRVRNYRRYSSANLLSLTGTWMQRIGQDWLVLQISDGSGVALGVITALQFAPTLLISFYGGVLADRYDKRRLLMITQFLMGVLALALGVLVRSSVGTIAAVVALMLVLPGIATALPGAWQDTVVPYLPAEAGQAIIGRTRFAPAGAHLLAPWAGFAILCAYTAVALIAAAATLTTRDSR